MENDSYQNFGSLSDGVFIDIGANLGQTLIEFWIANSEINYKNSFSITKQVQERGVGA